MSELDWDPYEDSYEDPIESKIGFCKDCQASFVWLKTKRGKFIAVETDDCNADDEIYDPQKHTCHWNICPNKEQIIKARPSAQEAFKNL